MWSNIGHKIKVLAKVLCWIGIVVSVIAGIAIIAGGSAINNAAMSYGYYSYNNTTGSTTLAGILVIILGALGSWIGSFTMYGFGELVDRAMSIDDKLSAQKPE